MPGSPASITSHEAQSVARGILESLSPQRLVLAIPRTDYKIFLVPGIPVERITTPVGKRIKGLIHARALRVFTASGGGRFIEPIEGEPRIVAGIVKAVDQANRRLLVDVAVPIWMTLTENSDASQFHEGELVNCYVESGPKFMPA